MVYSLIINYNCSVVGRYSALLYSYVIICCSQEVGVQEMIDTEFHDISKLGIVQVAGAISFVCNFLLPRFFEALFVVKLKPIFGAMIL